MNPRITALVVAAFAALAAPAAAQTDTEFTYQGRLDLLGEPYTGTADFRFTLWNAAIFGSQIGGELPLDGVNVEDGLFAAELDFGAEAFFGQRWLEISVRTPAWGGQGEEPAFTTLDPRQAVTRSPYSIQTRGIFVDDDERVGIGTTEVQEFTAATIRGRVAGIGTNDPQSRLHLASGRRSRRSPGRRSYPTGAIRGTESADAASVKDCTMPEQRRK